MKCHSFDRFKLLKTCPDHLLMMGLEHFLIRWMNVGSACGKPLGGAVQNLRDLVNPITVRCGATFLFPKLDGLPAYAD